jgi:MFS family permease
MINKTSSCPSLFIAVQCSSINHGQMKSSPLAVGVTKVNYIAFLFASFFTIGSFPFVAYCLIPLVVAKFAYSKQEARSILSCFVAIDQVVNIVSGSVWGWISEAFLGRKALFSGGLAVMALCIGAFPFATPNVHPMAIGWKSFGLMRLIFGFGASVCNVMFLAVASDYANEDAKSGIVAGGAGFAAGLGAVFSVVCMQRIKDYTKMCISMALSVALASLACIFCLKNVIKPSNGGKKNLLFSLSLGFKRCKEYRLLLSMISVFLARSNSLVSIVFVPKDAFTRTFSVCSLVGTLVFGGTLGRKEGTQEIGLLISSFLLATGYLGTLINGIPGLDIFCGVAAGLGQGGFIVCGMSLLAKCSKDGEKGALSATFSLFGSLGSLTASSMGYLVKGGKQNWGMYVYISLHSLYLILLGIPLVQRATAFSTQKAHKNCIKIPL